MLRNSGPELRPGRRAGSRAGWMLVFVVVAASTFSLPQAHAQQSESTGPWRDPGINYLEDSKPYVQWILGVLFIAGCVLIAIKNPHRTHLD